MLQHINCQIHGHNTNLDKYKGYPINKRMSAFERFKKYLIGEKVDDVLNEFREGKHCNIPGKYKIRVIAKAVAELWNSWILSRIANRHGVNVESKAVDKIKKSKQGKEEIDDEVSTLLLHLRLTNESLEWTEQKREALEQQLYQELAEELYKAAELVVPSEEFHTVHEEDGDVQYNVERVPMPKEYEQHADKSQGAWQLEKHGVFGDDDFGLF